MVEADNDLLFWLGCSAWMVEKLFVWDQRVIGHWTYLRIVLAIYARSAQVRCLNSRLGYHEDWICGYRCK